MDPIDALQSPDVLHPWPEAGTGRPGFRMTPRSVSELSSLLSLASQRRQAVAFSPAAARALPEEPVWVDLCHFQQVRQHRPADWTLRVETGITMGALDALLAPHGQAFALGYPPDTPLLDVLAEDRPALETGLGHGLVRGYPRDWVLGLEVLTPEGVLTQCGGTVVKNVTGYDLNKLYVGGLHQYGLITAASLRLVPRTTTGASVTFSGPIATPEAAWEVLAAYQEGRHSGLTRFELAMAQRQRKKLSTPRRKSKRSAAQHDWTWALATTADAEALSALMPPLLWDDGTVLSDKAATTLWHSLQHWPDNAWVLELAVPEANFSQHWASLQALCEEQPLAADLCWQMRPAAGLLYALWADTQDPPSVIDTALRLGTWCEDPTMAGVAQWLVPPPGQKVGPLAPMTAGPLLAAQARLLTHLDPAGILSTAATMASPMARVPTH